MSVERDRVQLLTPRASGGIAVLALSGADRHARAAKLLRALDGHAAVGALSTSPRLCMLCLGEEKIDQVLAFDRPERRCLEIHLHGSPALLDSLAGELDVCPVTPTPAEALLHAALSKGQLQLALEQLPLSYEEHVVRLEAMPGEAGQLERAASRERNRIALAHVEALPLVICGATNAGKSTLMNRLLHGERSLTGPQPGLTRDPVRELTELGGYPYLLIDTAGEGRAGSAIEASAQRRARAERSKTALRLLVVDGSRGPGALEAEILAQPCLTIRNKSDLPQAPWPPAHGPHLQISARQQPSSELRALIGAALRGARDLPRAGPVGGPAALDRRQLE